LADISEPQVQQNEQFLPLKLNKQMENSCSLGRTWGYKMSAKFSLLVHTRFTEARTSCSVCEYSIGITYTSFTENYTQHKI